MQRPQHRGDGDWEDEGERRMGGGGGVSFIYRIRDQANQLRAADVAVCGVTAIRHSRA